MRLELLQERGCRMTIYIDRIPPMMREDAIEIIKKYERRNAARRARYAMKRAAEKAAAAAKERKGCEV